MSKFLTTAMINAYLEELIKKTNSDLILVSPYLKFSNKIKELLSDMEGSGLRVSIIYGKEVLKAESAQLTWVKSQPHIDLYFYRDLHAKCYLNSSNAIVSSMNLYEFSQVNNFEMGVLLSKKVDNDAFDDCFDEVQRLLRISNKVESPVAEIKNQIISKVQEVSDNADSGQAGVVSKAALVAKKVIKAVVSDEKPDAYSTEYNKLTTSKLAKKYKMTTEKANKELVYMGCLDEKEGRLYLTDRGKSKGGEFRKGAHGIYFLWPENTFD
ncbi:phospholipase D family protein [Bacterioplanoides sp.]|uniref:phospholipase D family protein n=1 Tax=Bacterioplanoides sp. TaxID=2066072 RepID=UPI003B5A88B0